MQDVGALMGHDEILTCEEASAFLKVSNKTVLRLAREGEIPGQKVGRAWRFCRAELLAYVARGADESIPEAM
jgi:excisionase family DNA binding protein